MTCLRWICIIVLRWILNDYEMLMGYYEFGLLMNGSMSNTKDIECNSDERLYEYYEGSIVVLYWTLIVMNGWMSNSKGVLLCYWMLNCYGMFCLCITKDLLLCLLNVKLLWNTYTSIMKGLLSCCNECQVVTNRLNKQFKGYYHIAVSS